MNFTINKNKFALFRGMSIFFAASLIITAIIIVNENIDPANNTFGDLAFFILNLIVITTLFWVAKKSFKYGKRAFVSWTLIALSQLVTILGNVLWTIMYAELNKSPFPSIADILYLSYYPLLILGILFLPVARIQETKKYQILLDTGIMILSAGLVFWAVLIPIIEVHNTDVFSMFIYLSYLLMDIFILFILLYLLFDWFGQVKKMPLLLLALSVTVLVITNTIYICQFLYVVYIPGNFLDLGWLSSYFLTALAGISYITDNSQSSFKSLKYKTPFLKVSRSSYLPVLWLAFIYILLYWIYTQLTDDNLNILVWGAVIILTMMFVRQILDLKESNQARKLLQTNQEILEKREKHLSLITDNMMDLITRIDANGKYRYVSPSAPKVLGYTPENMLENNILDLVHPDDLEKLKSSAQKAVNTHAPNEVEYRHKTPSGDYIWIETAGTPIFDKNNFKGFVCGSKNINYRKIAEEQIKTSLEEKEVLLKEIHHRVKNNMQIISSLLSLQSRYIKDENYLAVFKEGQNRVKSMAMIHEGLYKSDNLARINFEEYVHNLISGLFSSYGIDKDIIKTKINLDNILLDIDTAIPLGLILNELISNSLKHAFPHNIPNSKNFTFTDHAVEINNSSNIQFAPSGGITSEINILLSQNEDMLKLVVGDNGIGFPENINFKNTESLGLQLVNTLVNQLNGEIKLEKENGTKFTLNLKK
ncbi:MAG: histidine kinase dimerization/phosphoacceptor domain -containing protein [Methanobacterium sp.]